MLRHLVRKEILDSLLNQRFVAIAVFSIVLMPLSAFINYEYHEARKAAFDGQLAEYQAEDPSSSNLRAYRVPVVLSALARGNEDPPPLDELPSFEVREPQLSNVLRSNVWAMVSLLAYLFIPFLVCYVAILRYDVR